MQITKTELSNIIDELESATDAAHNEFCYTNRCGCAFDLINEWRKRIEDAPQDTMEKTGTSPNK